MKTILVTGGAGFIGSHFIDLLVANTDYSIVVLDKLTYAGKFENMESFIDLDRVHFIKGDICDSILIKSVFDDFDINYVVNFAAESHVDNSIEKPTLFIESNVIGTVNLLESSYKKWKNHFNWEEEYRFVQISTDEVYGMLGESGKFSEKTCLNPSSPYSSSKASADLICLSYYKTYNFPLIITRSSNNYGPRQDREKLIPKVIDASLRGNVIPVYGNGENIRDWIYVKDNCNAILKILNIGNIGEVYNIAGDNELKNIDLIKLIICQTGGDERNICFVKDRLGHDYRYAVDFIKTYNLIGEFRNVPFELGIKNTIAWYTRDGS